MKDNIIKILVLLIVLTSVFIAGLKLGVSEGKQEIMDKLSDDVILILKMDESGVLKDLETINNHPSNDVGNFFHFSKIILRKK